MPFTTLLLLFVAAGKLMPLRVSELLVLVALARDILMPFTVVADAPVFPLVKENAARLSLLVELDEVCADVPFERSKLPWVNVTFP